MLRSLSMQPAMPGCMPIEIHLHINQMPKYVCCPSSPTCAKAYAHWLAWVKPHTPPAILPSCKLPHPYLTDAHSLPLLLPYRCLAALLLLLLLLQASPAPSLAPSRTSQATSLTPRSAPPSHQTRTCQSTRSTSTPGQSRAAATRQLAQLASWGWGLRQAAGVRRR
jgi:hypothetical protein